MKIKKLSAVIMAGAILCTAPAPVMASDADIDAAEEILMNNEVQSLLSDPDKVVDIIMYVKDVIDQQEVSDDQIRSAIEEAAAYFDITITDSDKDSLVSIARKFKDMDIDEEELRSQVRSVYDTLESLGIGEEEVKGFLEKAIDFVKSLI